MYDTYNIYIINMCLILIFVTSVFMIELDDRIDLMENVMRGLAIDLEQAFDSRCYHTSECDCSLNSC